MKSRFPPGVLMMIISGACMAALLVAYVFSNQQRDEIVTAWAGEVLVETSDELSAGDAASVIVSVDAADGTAVDIALFAPLSTTVFQGTVTGRSATVEIDGQYLEHAGLHRVVAEVDGSSSLPHALVIVSRSAVDPVVPLIGPRTIIADGADFTMAVVSPIDRYGNPVADGTDVEFDLLRPNGERAVVTAAVDRAISAIVITSTTETGRMIVSSSVGDSDGPANSVDQVAGVPAQFAIVADERNALADGFTLHQVQTSELRDVFGNLLPDGVAAVFVIDDGQKVSLIQSTVQAGIARAGIESPDEPVEVLVSARVSGEESAKLAVRFEAAVTEVPVEIVRSNAGLEISIGPVVTARGGYVADGTTATISDPRTGEVLATVALRGGIASLEIDDAELPLEVNVLGIGRTESAS